MILWAVAVTAAARLNAQALVEPLAPAPAALSLSPAAAGEAAGRWMEGWLGAQAAPQGLNLRAPAPIPGLPASAIADPAEAAAAEAAPAAQPEALARRAGPGSALGLQAGTRSVLRDAVSSPSGVLPGAPAPSLEALEAEGRWRFDQQARREAAALERQAASWRPASSGRGSADAADAASVSRPAELRGSTAGGLALAAGPAASEGEAGAPGAASSSMRGRLPGASSAASAAGPATARPPIVSLTLRVAADSLSVVVAEADPAGAAALSARWAREGAGGGEAAAAEPPPPGPPAETNGGAASSSRDREEGRAPRGSLDASARRSTAAAALLSPNPVTAGLPWWWLLPLAALALHYRREYL